MMTLISNIAFRGTDLGNFRPSGPLSARVKVGASVGVSYSSL